MVNSIYWYKFGGVLERQCGFVAAMEEQLTVPSLMLKQHSYGTFNQNWWLSITMLNYQIVYDCIRLYIVIRIPD